MESCLWHFTFNLYSISGVYKVAHVLGDVIKTVKKLHAYGTKERYENILGLNA
jgi:hypothetical protein